MPSTQRTGARALIKSGVDLAIATPVIGDPIYDALLKRSIRSGRNDMLTTPSELRRVFTAVLTDLRDSVDGPLTYFEAGVYAGHSHAVWHETAAELGVDTRSFGADSFQGLPDSVADDEGGWMPRMFRCSRRVTEWNLRRLGAPMDRITLVEGWFDRSLTPELARRVGDVHVAMLDADAYSSTVPVLRFLGPLLHDPCYLIFDDWYADNWDPAEEKSLGLGVERAFDEWHASNREWRTTHVDDYWLLRDDHEGRYGYVLKLQRAG